MRPAITSLLYCITLAGFLCCSAVCSAQSTSAEGTSPAPSIQPYYPQSASSLNTGAASTSIGSGAHLLNVTLGLLFILALIFSISWFVKRFGQGAFSGNGSLKIIATLPLGTRERIVLIDAGGKQLLLGITPTHINTLHVFETPVITSAAEANNTEFSRKLMALLQRNGNDGEAADNKKNSGVQE